MRHIHVRNQMSDEKWKFSRWIAEETTDQQWHIQRTRLVDQAGEEKGSKRKLASILSISRIDHRHCV